MGGARRGKDGFITADVVYKKVMWHPAVDKELVEIGYVDRFKGVLWVAAAQWGSKGAFDTIPWHRVVGFRQQGVSFWDREAKLDRLQELFDGALAAAGGAVDTQLSKAVPIPVRVFDPESDRWVGACLSDIGPADEGEVTAESVAPCLDAEAATARISETDDASGLQLRVVTWNVLNSKYDAVLTECDRRWARLLDAMAYPSGDGAAFDVICLQETDTAFTALLLGHQGVQQGYAVATDCSEPCDSIVLVRRTGAVQVSGARLLRHGPHKQTVLVDGRVGGEAVAFASVHLTSNHQDNGEAKRAKQLRAVMNEVHGAIHCVVMGDFNFGDGEENSRMAWRTYVDVTAGSCATFDPHTNPLAAWNSSSYLPSRYDRVLLRSGGVLRLVAQGDITILGNDASGWLKGSGATDSADPPPCAATAAPLALVVVRGAQGVGKSSLARAVAALWEEGGGRAARYGQEVDEAGDEVLVMADGAFPMAADVVRAAAGTRAARVLVVDVAAPAGTCACRIDAGGVHPLRGVGKAAAVVTATQRHVVSAEEVVAALAAAVPDVAASTLSVDTTSMDDDALWLAAAAVVEHISDSRVPTETFHLAALRAAAVALDPPGSAFPLLPLSDHYGVAVTLSLIEPSDGDGQDDAAGAEAEPNTPVPTYTGALHRAHALALVVPEYVARPIDRLRQKFCDKAALRWPAHCNIAWPFADPAADGVAEVVAAAVAAVGAAAPLRIDLSEVKYVVDEQRDRASLYIAPRCGDGNGDVLGDLQQAVLRGLDGGGDFASDGAAGEGGRYPHITLGRVKVAAADAAAAECTAALRGVGCAFTHLTHLARQGSAEYTPAACHPLPTVDAPHRLERLFPGGVPVHTAVETPRWLLEPHPLGGTKMLAKYSPEDALERFLLHYMLKCAETEGREAAARLVEDAATHVSQRGGRYHLPDDCVDAYLEHWAASRETARAGTAFWMEEVRGGSFRCYVDVDVVLTQATPFDAAAVGWLDVLVAATADFFAMPSLTCVITACHGEFVSAMYPAAQAKTGYRLYFLDVYVGLATYRSYLEALGRRFAEHVAASGCPEGVVPAAVPDVVDAQAVGWDRGRLLGTHKRRKNLPRAYELDRAVHCAAGKGVLPARGLTEHLRAHPLELLYATTLCMWGELPSFTCLPAELVPDVLQKWGYALIPTHGAVTAIDLITLKAAPYTSLAHHASHACVLGYDRPNALAHYAFVHIDTLAEAIAGVPPSADDILGGGGGLVEYICGLLRMHRAAALPADVARMASWRRLVAAATVRSGCH